MSALNNADDEETSYLRVKAREVSLRVLGIRSAAELTPPDDNRPLFERLNYILNRRCGCMGQHHYTDVVQPVRDQINREKMAEVMFKQPAVVGVQTREQEITRMVKVAEEYIASKGSHTQVHNARMNAVVKPYGEMAMQEVDKIAINMIVAEPPIPRVFFAKCIKTVCNRSLDTVPGTIVDALFDMKIKGISPKKPLPELKVGCADNNQYHYNSWVRESLASNQQYDATVLLAITLYPKIIIMYNGEGCAQRLRELFERVPYPLHMELGFALPGLAGTHYSLDALPGGVTPPWVELKHKVLFPGRSYDRQNLLPGYRPDHPLIVTEGLKEFNSAEAAYGTCIMRDPTLDMIDRLIINDQVESFKMLCKMSPEMGAYVQNACHAILLDPISFNSSKTAVGGAIDFARPGEVVDAESLNEPKLRCISHKMQAVIFHCCGHKGEVKIPSLTVDTEDLAYYIGGHTRGWCVGPESQAVQFRKFERRCRARNYLWQKVLWMARVRPWAWAWFQNHAEQEGLAEFVDGNMDGPAVLVGDHAQELGGEWMDPAAGPSEADSEESKQQKLRDRQITKDIKDPEVKLLYATHAAHHQALQAMMDARARDRAIRSNDSDSD